MKYPLFSYKNYSNRNYFLDINDPYELILTDCTEIHGTIIRDVEWDKSPLSYTNEPIDLFKSRIKQFKEFHDFKDKFEDHLNA